ncbi:hypothetical protein [Alicyclobacillus fructus]|uniref:hypothetical protein n=1 Tax=Alicyclobacillus fructus TaxID=2816082 RepID=UPI001A900F73|nr:hypothetical protein [Alicyclobacillus fructus]
MTPIARVYEARLESPGDVMFLPSALVLLLENGQTHIYSEGGMHNFWRSTCARHPWRDLENGLEIQGHHVRLIDVTEELAHILPRTAWTARRIVRAWYEQSPRQRFYLRRHVQDGRPPE